VKSVSLNKKNKPRYGWIAVVSLILLAGFSASSVWRWPHLLPGRTSPEFVSPNVAYLRYGEHSSISSTSTPFPEADVPLKPLPSSKVISGRKHLYQSFNNCGPASLSMLLSYFDIDVSQAKLGDELRPVQHAEGDNDDKSVTLSELAKKAEEYSLAAYHRPAGNIELVKRFISYDIPVLTRTWLKPNEDIGHYRIVRGYNEDRGVLIQDDSLQGKNRRYSYDEFFTLWEPFNYEFLVLVPREKRVPAEEILGDLKDGDAAWEKTLELSERELESDPDNYYARFNKSIALYNLGKYEDSIKAFEMSEGYLPRRMLWYQIEPIKAYYKVGDYDRVLAMIGNLLENGNRAFSELYYLRGLIHEKRGEESKAEENFANAERYNPTGFWKVNVEDL